MQTNQIELKTSRALRTVITEPWSIMEGNLMQIMEIASRSNLDISAAAKISEDKRIARMEAMSGEWLKGTRSVFVTNEGVAVVPVFDALFRRADLFDAISGAMSMEMIEKDFQVAMQSRKVKSIFMDIDSPGGTVNYTEELSNSIFASRGMKPMEAFASGMMCSAAFWIGSSANRINVTRSAMVGSVGVIASYVSADEYYKKMGIEHIEIVSSFSPDKNPDPATPDGKKKIQAVVDALGNVFVAAVSRNLEISEDVVKGWKGDVKIGQEAVDAGMAHQVVYRDAVMSSLTQQASSQPVQSSVPIAFSGQEIDASQVSEIRLQNGSVISLNKDNADVPTATSNDVLMESIASELVAQNDEENNGEETESSDTIDSNTEGEEETMSTENKKGMLAALGTLAGHMGLSREEIAAEAPIAAVEQEPVRSEREQQLIAEAAKNFVQLNSNRIIPAAAEPLENLFKAAYDKGIEGDVKAFVAAMPETKLTTSVIPTATNGNGYGTAIEPSSEEDAELQQAQRDAEEFANSDKHTDAE